MFFNLLYSLSVLKSVKFFLFFNVLLTIYLFCLVYFICFTRWQHNRTSSIIYASTDVNYKHKEFISPLIIQWTGKCSLYASYSMKAVFGDIFFMSWEKKINFSYNVIVPRYNFLILTSISSIGYFDGIHQINLKLL